MATSTDLAAALRKPAINLGITARYKEKLIKRIMQKQKYDQFWSAFIAPNLMLENLNQHIAVHHHKKNTFCHRNSRSAQAAFMDGTLDQGQYPLFSNTMRIPSFGPGFPRFGNKWAQEWEKPIYRGSIGQFWTFTFEWDSEQLGALQQQFDWAWKTGADGLTEIQRLDRHLKSRFKDYRGYCVIWSGGKSVHINFIFDTSHLSKATIIEIAERQGKNPEAKLRDYWVEDINPDAIWDYYTATWNRLDTVIRDNSTINVKFDTALATLFQKRRTPWGMRVATADDIHGFDEGDRIPQAVLDEALLRAAPKNAADMLLRAADANAMSPMKAKSIRPSVKFSTINNPAVLQKMTTYLADAWGSEYPKPAEFFEDSNGVGVHFYNSATDVKPSSIVYADYCSVLFRGKDAPPDTKLKYLPGKQSLNDMLCDLLDEIHAQNNTVLVTGQAVSRLHRYPWTGHFNRNASDQTVLGIRRGMAGAARMLSESRYLAIILSAEGAGKSTALIRQAGEFRLEDQIEDFFMGRSLTRPNTGHQIVSCKAYAQVEEQFLAYSRWREDVMAAGIRISPPAPLLIRSFSEIYRGYCKANRIDNITDYDALSMGFDSLVEAVLEKQPDVFKEVSDIKNQSWQYCDAKGMVRNGFKHVTSVLVFTVHDMAQRYNQISKSKAWLNPSFEPSALNDTQEWTSLAADFHAYRVIHDELAISDLVHIGHFDEVQLANKFRAIVTSAAGDDWKHVKRSERVKLFKSNACSVMREIGFYRIDELAELNFDQADVAHIDFDALPFGVTNSEDALYRRTHGMIVYVRGKNWWSQIKARVIITTTETLPANLAESIFSPPQSRHGIVIRWDSNAFFQPDSVRLKVDERANKKGVSDLASSLLHDPNGATDVVISDMASGGGIFTHSSARGSNDLSDQNIATILTSIGEQEYMELNAIAQMFHLDDVITSFYLDRYNQAAGRNRGLRGNRLNPKQHDVYMTNRLLRGLGGAAVFHGGRYPAYLVP